MIGFFVKWPRKFYANAIFITLLIFHIPFITFFFRLANFTWILKLELMLTNYLHFLLESICTWFFFFDFLYLFQVICNLKWTRIILHGFFCKHPIQVAGNFICDLNKKRGGYFWIQGKKTILYYLMLSRQIYIIYFLFLWLDWYY